MSNLIGQIKVEVGASLHVSEETFKTCMSLISMYMHSNGEKMMVVTQGVEYWAGYSVERFPTIEEFEDSMKRRFGEE